MVNNYMNNGSHLLPQSVPGFDVYYKRLRRVDACVVPLFQFPAGALKKIPNS